MRAPISWVREYVDLPQEQTGRELAAELIALGLEVETVERIAEVTGPVVVGRVAEIEELTDFKKPIRFCQVDVGPDNGGVRGIVCGARNFAVGDLVVVALPGAVLPGGFEISARQTYGRTSDGMICSARELGVGDNHEGILVLADSYALGTPAAEFLPLNEDVLDIAVTPDRGYALSIRGIAREAAIVGPRRFRDVVLDLDELPAPANDQAPRDCGSDDPVGCDLFTLRTVVDVDAAAPTPLWMAARLTAAGMRPVNLIVDITNYVMLETGQPLHAFDADNVVGPVVARRAVAGEALETLDHVRRSLSDGDLVIADNNGPLALAGTMGGVTSEISTASRNILLEAAHFDPIVVARMSRRHKLSSEASRRFERGVDSTIAPYASEMAVSLILRFAGGHYVGMTAQEVARERTTITISAQTPARVAGMPVESSTVISCLEQVGCAVTVEGDELLVLPPSWRPDLTDPADLVEEVLRLIGYDEIPATLPMAPAGRGLTASQQLRRRISRTAAALGMTEVLAYPFVGERDFDLCQFPVDDPRRRTVTLANPLSDEQPGLRTTLLPGLLNIARRNTARAADAVAIFEAGTVVFPRVAAAAPPRLSVAVRPSDEDLSAVNDALPVQRRHIGGVLSGDLVRAGWWGNGRSADWADAISVARGILEEVGLTVTVDAAQNEPFHPGRCAVLSIDDRESDDDTVIVGYAGELHPKVCAGYDLPARACAFELDLDLITSAAADRVRRGPDFSSMPVAKEDLAFVVDENVKAADVTDVITEAAGALLESVRLFDVYQGQQLGEGQKSLAFALRLRADDRTLSVDELASVRAAVIDAVVTQFAAQLRG